MKVLVLPTEILPSPPLIRYIRAKYLWSNEWWFLLALSASSRQKLRGIFLQFVSAVGGAGAVGMLTEYSTLPHFKNLARYILPQHTISSSKKDIPIFFYHKVNPFLVTAQSFDETIFKNIYSLFNLICQWINIYCKRSFHFVLVGNQIGSTLALSLISLCTRPES